MANTPEEHPSRDPKPDREKENVSWIDNLAQRSTGLPEGSGRSEANPSRNSSQPTQEKSPWAMAGVGIQFAVTAAVFAFIGYFLDKRFGWSPWGVIGFSLVGFVGGLYLLIKEFLKDQGGK